MTKDYRRELQGLLRKLFQFDSADLDFGIYRIMNYKRDEIENFIEEDLIKAVDVEFEKYSAKSKEEIEKELEGMTKRISSTFGEDALLPSGDIKEMYRGSPIAKEFYKKKEDLKNNEMADQYKAEIFSYIYQFFSRYYDEGDFISLRRYSRQNKYAVPYNGEEVLLHWANRGQYYIKTGEYFTNYSFRIGDYKINFRLLRAETDQNNNQSGNRYFLLRNIPENISYDENKKELTVLFEYRILASDETSKYGMRDIQKKILDEAQTIIAASLTNSVLKGALQKQYGDRTLLDKHLLRYTKRNTTDYFIHKDLGSFLSGELDFYIKNEIIILDDLGSNKETDVERYISRIRVVKSISTKVINFLAQIEDFQKNLFEKKKFVVKSEYCITIDLVPEELYGEIIKNSLQINAWKDLISINKNPQEKLFPSKEICMDFLKNNPYLMIDTRFFSKDFKDTLIASFKDLDASIGGLLVLSENWQALSLLNEKYRGKVCSIFIDPPYNTGQDLFMYKDNYQHSSWLTMLENRLSISRQFLSDFGLLFITIDSVEVAKLRLLCDTIFGEDNFLADVSWEKRYTRSNNAKKFYSLKDTVMSYRKGEKLNYLRELRTEKSKTNYTNPDKDHRGPWISSSYVNPATKEQRPNLVYPIINPFTSKKVEHPSHAWKYDPETHQTHEKENRLYWGLNHDYDYPRLKTFLTEANEGMVPVDIWKYQDTGTTDDGGNILKNLFGRVVFDNPKPPSLVQRAFQLSQMVENDYFLDFFAGSGTTAHAVLNMNKEDGGNRKYILVEMADYLDTVILPRIQKIIYSNNWLNAIPENNEGTSHFLKYIYLEQYEDTLNNIEFSKRDKAIQITLQDLESYFLRYMLKFETMNSSCRLNVDKLSRPFEYTLKITRNNEIRDEIVNLPETFNYLLGLNIKRIKTFNSNGSYYKAIFGTKIDESIAIIWRMTDGLDLEADKKFIEDHILKEFKANKVYVNSDCFVEGVIPIEPEFKRLMEV
jgi:adenine-specific DNA-methyltransferase